MHLVVYISLNAIYFLFGVLLVNTIRKEFFRQAEDKVFKKLEIDDIFIPDNKNKNNYYLNEILKMKKHPKYIFIFPESNRLVNLDEFWNILRLKYYRHLKFLHNFIVPTYDIDTISDVRRLETDIYTKHSFPLMFILKKKNSKNKILGVYNLFDDEVNSAEINSINKYLSNNLKNFDIVIVVDYGHGFLSSSTINLINKK